MGPCVIKIIKYKNWLEKSDSTVILVKMSATSPAVVASNALKRLYLWL